MKDFLHYQLNEIIGQGGFGEVWSALDTTTETLVAIKFNNNKISQQQELKILTIIKNAKIQGFCKILQSGLLEEKTYYIVMNQLGKSLRDIAQEQRRTFSLQTCCLIGVQMIDRLQDFHSVGYVHADIKPDNVLIGSNNYFDRKSSQLSLIDYGLSTPYLLENGSHKPVAKSSKFVGNVGFASKHSFNQMELTRRDDIISLLYMLLFLLEGGLPWMKNNNKPLKEQYKEVGKLKNNMTPEYICSKSRKSLKLLSLVKNAYILKYSEEPDYQWYKDQFNGILDSLGGRSSFQFDWIEQKVDLQKPSQCSPSPMIVELQKNMQLEQRRISQLKMSKNVKKTPLHRESKSNILDCLDSNENSLVKVNKTINDFQINQKPEESHLLKPDFKQKQLLKYIQKSNSQRHLDSSKKQSQQDSLNSKEIENESGKQGQIGYAYYNPKCIMKNQTEQQNGVQFLKDSTDQEKSQFNNWWSRKEATIHDFQCDVSPFRIHKLSKDHTKMQHALIMKFSQSRRMSDSKSPQESEHQQLQAQQKFNFKQPPKQSSFKIKYAPSPQNGGNKLDQQIQYSFADPTPGKQQSRNQEQQNHDLPTKQLGELEEQKQQKGKDKDQVNNSFMESMEQMQSNTDELIAIDELPNMNVHQNYIKQINKSLIS